MNLDTRMDVLIGGTIFVLAMLVVSRVAQWLHVSAPLLLRSVGLGASFLPFFEALRLPGAGSAGVVTVCTLLGQGLTLPALARRLAPMVRMPGRMPSRK